MKRPPNIKTNLGGPFLIIRENQTESFRKYLEYNMIISFSFLPDESIPDYDLYAEYLKRYC